MANPAGVHAPSYAEPDVMALRTVLTVILTLALLATPLAAQAQGRGEQGAVTGRAALLIGP